MLNLLIILPTFKSLLSPALTCNYSFLFLRFLIDLSFKILNDFPSHPVLLCLKNIGNPSSKKINMENKSIIGKENNMKITESILSMSVLIKKLVP